MFCGGFNAQRTDDSYPLAERDGKRSVARASPDQEHGRMANRIRFRHRRMGLRLIVTPAHDGGMQCANPKCRTQTRAQAIPVRSGLRERDRIFGKGCVGIDRDEGQIGLDCGDLFGKPGELSFGGLRLRNDDAGRLAPGDRAWGLSPGRIDNRKHAGAAKRGRERRLPCRGHDDDGALHGHRKFQDQSARIGGVILVHAVLMPRQRSQPLRVSRGCSDLEMLRPSKG